MLISLIHYTLSIYKMCITGNPAERLQAIRLQDIPTCGLINAHVNHTQSR